MPIYSDSDNEITPKERLFRRDKPVEAILGRGRVAELLLWKNQKLSGAVMLSVTILWFLFEVVEYNFVTLFCHLAITTMLIIFIWSTGSEFFNWSPPKTPDMILHDPAFKEFASNVNAIFNRFLRSFLHVACGRDPAKFFVSILVLYVISVIGTYFDLVNFLFFGFICLGTVPIFYEKYQHDVDKLAWKVNKEARRTFKKLDSNVFNKIPRGPVKDKKHK
ncbi:hypothetical protein ACFE04_005906 [Oxalis oulophora]